MSDELEPAGAMAASATEEARVRRRSQDQRSEEMRLRLIDAAVKVMIERGYAGFRIAEVAQVAGVSRGAQVHHFHDRDGLITAALEAVMASIRASTSARIEAAVDGETLLDAVAADGRDFFFSHRFPMALDMLMSAGKDARLQTAVRTMSTAQRGSAEAAWAERLTEAGMPADEAADVVWLIWSVIRGLAVRAFVDRDDDRTARVMELTLELLKEETVVTLPS